MLATTQLRYNFCDRLWRALLPSPIRYAIATIGSVDELTALSTQLRDPEDLTRFEITVERNRSQQLDQRLYACAM